MALIQMSHTWPDGANLTITISGKARYPDALGDLRAEAERLWTKALGDVTEPVAADGMQIAFTPDGDDELDG